MNITFEGKELRTVIEGGQPWWIVKDVCDVLGIANHRDASRGLPKPTKGVVLGDTPGGTQKMTTVNEDGLYRLIFKSEKPEAKRFQDFIYGEVLPSIRKHGSYPPPSGLQPVEQSGDPFLAMLKGVETLYLKQQELDQRTGSVERRLENLESERERSLDNVRALPEPKAKVRELSMREKCRLAINELVRLTGLTHQEAWRRAYHDYSYQAGVNLTTRAKNKGIGKMDWVEEFGDIELLYGVIVDLAEKAA